MEVEEEMGLFSQDTPRQTGSTKEKVIPPAKILVSKEGLFPCLNMIKPGHLESQHFCLDSF